MAELCKTTRKKMREDIYAHKKKMIEEIIGKNTATNAFRREKMTGKKWIAEMKDKNGIITTERKRILEIATEYYEELYNSRENPLSVSEGETRNRTDEHIDPITKEEIRKTINTLKNNKATDADGITNEMLKLGGEHLQEPLETIFNKILQEERSPEEWEISEIILVHKKGERNDENATEKNLNQPKKDVELDPRNIR